MERLALARLTRQIASSPNYDSLQSANRSGHSMETALLKVKDGIYCHVDSASAVALVGLDISSAFEAVIHKTLVDRRSMSSALLIFHWIGFLPICPVDCFAFASEDRHLCHNDEHWSPARVNSWTYLVCVIRRPHRSTR